MFDKIHEGRWWDFGWQLVEGCTKVSEACDNGWSLEKEHRFGISRDVKFIPERLTKPLKRKKPASYAIWNDFFHEDISFDCIDKVMNIIKLCPQHIFQILTKRPDRMDKYFKNIKSPIKFPLNNIFLGTTVESDKHLWRVKKLVQIPAKIRFVSCEPLLGEIKLNSYGYQFCNDCNKIVRTYMDGAENEFIGNACLECDSYTETRNIDWVIAGGETGHKARPMHPDWVRSLRDQCKDANVPFFFKGWGEYKPFEQTYQPPFYRDAATCKEYDSHGMNFVDPHTSEMGKWNNGRWLDYPFVDNCMFLKVGKKKSGRLLDGKEYNEMPII